MSFPTQHIMDIKKLTIRDVQDGYAKKAFSPDEVQAEFAALIAKENPFLNAYLSVFDPSTLYPIPYTLYPVLAGVHCAIKDNILIEGTITTAGSKILEDYRASYDAT